MNVGSRPTIVGVFLRETVCGLTLAISALRNLNARSHPSNRRPYELTPKELKQELVAAGFQVYRSEAKQLQLAVRVRDNLIMDSGVWVTFDPQQALGHSDTLFGVRCVFRSQQSDHAADGEDQAFRRARELAEALTPTGYVESERRVVQVENPSHPGQLLDTWREVVVEKGELGWEELLTELRAALQATKIA